MSVAAIPEAVSEKRPRPVSTDRRTRARLLRRRQREAPSVWVRRSPTDLRRGLFREGDVEGLHMGRRTGGRRQTLAEEVLCARVWCDQLAEGELGHSCAHGAGPHLIRVVILPGDNEPAVYRRLLAAAEGRRTAEAEADLQKWQRMAVKRLKERKPMKALHFTTDALAPAEVYAIRERLREARTEGDVRGAFRL